MVCCVQSTALSELGAICACGAVSSITWHVVGVEKDDVVVIVQPLCCCEVVNHNQLGGY